jgi:hypothetical protein
MIFVAWCRWRWLHVRLAWWSFWVTIGVRACRKSLKSMERPSIWARWTWRRVHRWNDRRTAIILELTRPRPGTWHGDAHPVQQWMERDPKRSPQWWRAHASARSQGRVKR